MRQAQLGQGLAVVGARCAGEAVTALPQVDLVHVQLQDFVLGERLFNAVGQQGLFELALQGPVLVEEKCTRHLHGDGRSTLWNATGQVGKDRTCKPPKVQAAVVVEALIFNRQQCVFQCLGRVFYRHKVAALLAKLADQHVVSRVDTQRHFGPVVRYGFQCGQARRKYQQGVPHEQNNTQQHHGGDTEHPLHEWLELDRKHKGVGS